jgi:hypothetical protein
MMAEIADKVPAMSTKHAILSDRTVCVSWLIRRIVGVIYIVDAYKFCEIMYRIFIQPKAG